MFEFSLPTLLQCTPWQQVNFDRSFRRLIEKALQETDSETARSSRIILCILWLVQKDHPLCHEIIPAAPPL